jgi:dTDP-4-dehydrorhamnose reductase
VRALITGATGQLATNLLSTVPAGVQLASLSRAECDITELSIVEKAFRSFRPDIIINTAAYTAVEAAEGNQELAYQVNARGAGNVAKAAQLVGSRLIHISTDYVFDGKHSTPYPPEAPTNPLNVYGASKLAGEEAVQIESPAALIIRTSSVYSTTGKNFFLTILDLLSKGATPRVVTDQRGSPTFASDLAEVLWLCSFRTDLKGIYHFANAGDASWYQFACEIRALVVGKSAATLVPEIVPITSAEHNARAVRPRYSVLDSSALLRDLCLRARSWDAALRQVFDQTRGRARIS